MEEERFRKDFSLPFEWLQVLAHPSTKDKASLLYKLNHEMTISDVYDLMEYQHYENWMAHEDELKNNRESYSHR